MARHLRQAKFASGASCKHQLNVILITDKRETCVTHDNRLELAEFSDPPLLRDKHYHTPASLLRVAQRHRISAANLRSQPSKTCGYDQKAREPSAKVGVRTGDRPWRAAFFAIW